jgi:oligo-1,6-glucosidase
MTINPRSKTWWKEQAVYQIYPASFCDSDGDGIGDLGGIDARLEYLQSLGIRVIWICPMYKSPQVDMGYDISDYEAVHEPYGDLAQMQALIDRCQHFDMKVMLDLVINHTSDQHRWFQESRSSIDNPKRDWYIWRPAKTGPAGERLPPNNWRSNFGAGSAWEWDEATGEYYLHLFAREQPDLNWENEEARHAIYKSAMEFWLQRGVSGFRVDTVNMYSKPPGLPDAPIVDPSSPYQPAGLLYSNGPRMHEYLSEMNDVLARYDAITVGELPHTPDMATVMRYVSAEARQLNMVFQFDVVDIGQGKTHKYETTPKDWALSDLKAAVGRTQNIIRGTDAWTTVFMENHDQGRSVSRFADDSPEHRVAGAKMLAMLQACLSGTLFIYQGQELGCINAPLDDRYPLESYVDIESRQFLDKVRAEDGDMTAAWRALQHLARDHARIPMAWDGSMPDGGFAAPALKEGRPAALPWMAPHPLAGEINMQRQLHEPLSVLKFWRVLLGQRQLYSELLIYGDYEVVRADDTAVFAFTKTVAASGARMLVVLNFGGLEFKWALPMADELGLPKGDSVTLQPVLSTHWTAKRPEGVSAEVPMRPWEGRMYMVNA